MNRAQIWQREGLDKPPPNERDATPKRPPNSRGVVSKGPAMMPGLYTRFHRSRCCAWGLTHILKVTYVLF